MVRQRISVVVSALLVSILAWPVITSAQPVPNDKVEQAIQKAINYIQSQQKNGNWEVVAKPDISPGHHHLVNGWQWGGLSGVALCSLLYAGESAQETHVKTGIDWLKNQEIYGVYALGFRCQVWALAPSGAGVKQAAQKDKEILMAALLREKNGGFYGYYYDPKLRRPGPDEDNGIRPRWDASVSQYGVLGMWAIAQLNIEMTDEYWRFTENAWRNTQMKNGGWAYVFGKDGDWGKDTVAMTAAGLATLFITQERAHQMEGLECKGNIVDPHIEAALKWMNQNFRRFEERHPFYSLYGVERVGVASGYKYFGNLNWFDVGANFLLSKQNADGSWGNADANDNAKKIPDTAFALMFLARGRAPVMMNKLDYVNMGPNNKPLLPSWNQRPREVANIARWAGRQKEQHLNWQVVNMQSAMDDWHDAPIMWMSGRDEINLKKDEVEKLKRFVQEGGLIFGNADCGKKQFIDGFKKLGQQLFPMYEFRELPESHAIYTNQQFRRDAWPKPPFMQGLSNGVRELMVLAPNDVGRLFQVQSFAGPNEGNAQAVSNLFLYTVDKTPLNRGQNHIVRRRADAKVEKTIKVARLEYAGNWDPEPGGWWRLANYMVNQHKTDLQVETVKLGDGKLSGGGYNVAHLTGTTKLKLPEAQQQELKDFVDKGGTLVVDAAGGAAEFGLTSEQMLNTLFQQAGGIPVLAASHPVYAAADKLTDFVYRPFAKKQIGNMKGPRIRGFEIAKKVRVFYSPEDLSAGIMGKNMDGIFGYDPKTATSIMADILIYSTQK